MVKGEDKMNIQNGLTAVSLAQYFDHTQLRANATEKDLVKLCEESKKYHFRMVAINSEPVALCKELLKNTDIHVGAAISFPLGQTSIPVKVFETNNAIEAGADEIDYVIHIGKLKDGDYNYIEKEMAEIVSACRHANVISKVIFENCYLTQKEKNELCYIALSVRPDFIKTSTGFGTGGATVSDVNLMKEIVKDHVKVKAAGGIRTLKDTLEMIEAGADRIGSTASTAIVEEFMNIYKEG